MKDTREIIEFIKEYEKRESDLQLDNEQLRQLNTVLQLADEKSAILSSIVSSTDDAIISKNLDGIITSWNESAFRIFGYTPEEIIGASVLKLIPLDRQHEEPKILEQLKKGIRVDHFETQRLRKDGAIVEVSLTISPIVDDHGTIIGLSKIARDISMQRRAEIDSKRLNAIIASSDDAIISKDLDGIVTSWNSAAVRIFGYSADEIIGQSILTLIPPDRHEEEPKILSELRKGNRVDHFETVRRKKDGTLINVSLTISPIKDRVGNVVGLSKIARDITEKKLAEKKKDEFIGFVSHELKTPLTSLRSYIQVALHKLKDENQQFVTHALIKAEQQTKKMENMITDFLNISRLEDGQMKLELSTFDLASTIKSNIEEAGISSAKHQLRYDGEDEVLATGDADKISLVLTNLISNAQKYAPQGGEITVFCEREGSELNIKVKDQGIGISEVDQKNMFKKFYRIESDKTRFISGFGIGLYLANSIINLHGSSINVESELGKGSIFSFRLNAAE